MCPLATLTLPRALATVWQLTGGIDHVGRLLTQREVNIDASIPHTYSPCPGPGALPHQHCACAADHYYSRSVGARL